MLLVFHGGKCCGTCTTSTVQALDSKELVLNLHGLPIDPQNTEHPYRLLTIALSLSLSRILTLALQTFKY